MSWVWQGGQYEILTQATGGGTFISAFARNCNGVASDMKKNVAGQKVGIQMVSATDGSAFTGAVTAYVTGDAGTQAAGSVGAGACTHEGNGFHTYAPAQAETNYDHIGFTFTGSGAVPATLQVYTSFPQTGDSYVEVTNGTYGLSAIENLVDDIGAAGAGLTAIPWNAAWDAEVQSEVADALAVYDPPTNAEMEARTIVSASYALEATLTNMKGATFDTSTDSLEALRNRGDAAWITATGFSTLSSADVSAAVWEAATASYGGAGSYGLLIETNIDAAISSRLSTAGYTAPDNASITSILADTNELQTDWVNGGRLDIILDARASQTSVDTIDGIVDNILIDTAEIGAAGAGLTALATQASVNTIDDFLDTEVAAIKAVTDKLDSALELDGAVYRYTTNALEQAPTGGSAPTAADIADAVWDEAIAGHVGAGTFGLNLDVAISTRLATAGYTAPLDAAGTRSAMGLASANLDTQLADIPTVAEFNARTVTSATYATTADLATVDTVVDGIKAKTDSLTFTVAGQVDSNVQYVNDVQVTGTGANGDEWGP